MKSSNHIDKNFESLAISLYRYEIIAQNTLRTCILCRWSLSWMMPSSGKYWEPYVTMVGWLRRVWQVMVGQALGSVCDLIGSPGTWDQASTFTGSGDKFSLMKGWPSPEVRVFLTRLNKQCFIKPEGHICPAFGRCPWRLAGTSRLQRVCTLGGEVRWKEHVADQKFDWEHMYWVG